MRTEGMRQSDRVTLRLEVECYWLNGDGVVVTKPAQSLLVSRNGGVIRLQERLFTGQEMTLRRTLEGDEVKTVRARIVAEIHRETDGFLYAVAVLEPRADFWEIEFPSMQQGEQALGRLLIECSSCQRRESVYLNAVEMKTVEVPR